MLIILLLLSKTFLYKIVINYLLSPFLMLFFRLYNIFFTFFCFPNVINFILNVARAIKKMSVNEVRDIIFEKYYKSTGFSKSNEVLEENKQQKNTSSS